MKLDFPMTRGANLATSVMLASLFLVFALFLLSRLGGPDLAAPPAGTFEPVKLGLVYLPSLEVNSTAVDHFAGERPGFTDSILTTVLSQFRTLVYLLILLVVAGLLCWYLYSRTSNALLVYIYALPLHMLVLTILIAQFNLPLNWVRFIAAWKEILLGCLLLVVLVRVLAENQTLHVNFLDVVALAWLTLVLLYLFFPALVKSDADWVTRLYGARDWLLYLVPYFVGRLISISGRMTQRVFAALLIVGGITSVVGILDYLFVPLEWHVKLGVPRYFGDFLGLKYPDYLMGLPENYWVSAGDTLIRRAVSVYFSGQGFAIPFLVILPVVFLNYLRRQNWPNLVLLCACSVALLLTITRMTIFACLVQLVFLVLVLNRKRIILVGVGLATAVLLMIVVLNPTVMRLVLQTLTLQDRSSQVRPAQWEQGIELLQDHPLGLGLGTTGLVSSRFRTGTIGGGSEAGYFKVTGALGWLGLAFFLAWFAGIIAYAALAVRHFEDYRQCLGLIVLVIALGYLINNLTAPPDQIPFVIYIFPWLAGATVRFAGSFDESFNERFVSHPDREPRQE